MTPRALSLLFCLLITILITDSAFSQSRTRTRRTDAKLLEKFDADKNGWLNAEERKAAKEFHEANSDRRPRRRGRGDAEPIEIIPGAKLKPGDVAEYPDAGLYDTNVLRTLFLTIDSEDWESEMAAFYHTDVEMPATLQTDGKTLENIGVQFRGNSSFFAVPDGRKRSMSLTFDHVKEKQNLYGYRATTLLNAHADPTFLHSVLYLDIVKDYLPAPKANYVHVVINGRSWGVYINQQRYNKDFLKDAFGTTKGIRFKSSNRSRGGGFSYHGEEPDKYRAWYEIKSADKDESWKTLIDVCRILKETPPESLKEKLDPIFNIDGALRYLALDIVMMSGDGYWLHGSDFNIYIDKNGKLNLLHHDTNEAFTAQSETRGGERHAKTDPFANLDDPNKALRQKLLAVPEFRDQYLRYVRQIAKESLDWKKIGPKIEAYRKLIDKTVRADTRKLYSTELFDQATYGDGEDMPPATTLKGFILRRRAYLLNHPEIKSLKD